MKNLIGSRYYSLYYYDEEYEKEMLLGFLLRNTVTEVRKDAKLLPQNITRIVDNFRRRTYAP
jgi:hypothetical protein